MKKYITVFLFCILGFIEANGQTVQVCITQDGVAKVASSTVMFCRNDTTNLVMTNCATTPETNISYAWRNLDVAPNADSLKSSIMAQKAGRWVAYITNNTTMVVYTDTITLVHPPAIAITAMTPNGGVYCPLTPVTINLTQSGPIVSWQWYQTAPSYSIITGATNSSFTFYDKPKAVSVIGKDMYGCSDTLTSGFFNLSSAPPANIGADPAPLCIGGSINLQNLPAPIPPAYGQVQYGYYRAGTFISGVFPGTVASPSSYNPATISFPTAGTIKVWFWVKPFFGGCENADTVNVTVLPVPTVNLGNDTLICYGVPLTITPTLVGTGPYNASSPGLGWSSSPAGYSSSTTTTTVNPTSTTTYTLRVEDANVCGVGQDDIVVSVNPQINITLTNDLTICKLPADSAYLTANVSGGLPNYSYTWSPLTTLFNIVDNPTTGSTATARSINQVTYTFTATDASNCSASEDVTVSTYEPEIAPIASPITISETVNTTMVALLPSNANFNFAWTDTTGASYGTENFLYREYEGPDTVVYVITVTDPNNNCQNKDTIEVWSISDNILLYVPNIFSPNAQNPTNQRLRIYGDNLLPTDFKMIVYNKWGNLVYESTDLTDTQVNGWDGGAMVEGVYTYVIIGKFKNGKDVNESPNYKGTFSLVR